MENIIDLTKLAFLQNFNVRQNGQHSLVSTMPKDRGFKAGDTGKMYGVPGNEKILVIVFPDDEGAIPSETKS